MRFYWLIIGTLAVWRVTHLLQAEDGPWDLIVRLRRSAGEGFFGRLLDCFYCLSIWTALPVALLAGQNLVEQLILWPALSGSAILVERVTAALAPRTATYMEDSEENHGMLRERSSGSSADGDAEDTP